jgi:hypothetical protein
LPPPHRPPTQEKADLGGDGLSDLAALVGSEIVGAYDYVDTSHKRGNVVPRFP